MIGTVGLEALHILCVVGIYPHEREQTQSLFVDVEVDQDFSPAAASDRVDDTVDYDRIAELLTGLAKEREYQLIETFAVEGADLLLESFPALHAVRLHIRKPAAVDRAECSFVRLERTRAP